MDEDLPQTPCFVCKKTDQNKIDYGDFIGKSNISVHYFCLVRLLFCTQIKFSYQNTVFLAILKKFTSVVSP